ncbi:putative membrane protein [Saccharothrix coeruleofusca]|uniref:DUF2243 domain-containing protein n=1 Tax=Saccharothrix coeruleofusca TaxID=33919 RepID=UPI001AE4C5F3|nr:DUF2243 domain-containing protein [Saccharothrix coeruleofusca]MBP2336165.1 putative membrane protein [Saccharothrix coeruleofusca]
MNRGALVLGLGIGGFIDGIVAHQLLGWHHMLSGWYPPDTPENLHLNMRGDGWFHLLCLVLVLAGTALLNRSTPLPARVLWGGVLAGWGVFNLVEGVVDHLVLGIHHVRHGPSQLAYDIGFLVLGVVLLLAGALLARSTTGGVRR